jgi:D-amino-acid dehydrogenase
VKTCIIGGGIIGLSCAYYLHNEGHSVTVIDKGSKTNNCSFGNAGYISPSHFIPLASPGIVAQGLKWMLSSTSPFYIKPRMDISLIKWGLAFWGKSTEKTVKQSAPHLNNILQLSRNLTIKMNEELGGKMELKTEGCLMLYRKESTADHERHLAKEAKTYGIDTKMLTLSDVQAMEPDVQINALGGAYYPIDCHLNPTKTMEALQAYLVNNGVKIMYETEVKDFVENGNTVSSVVTSNGDIDCDQVVIAAGSWLPLVVKKLGINMLLQPGKGYSTTYQNIDKNLHHPAILVDDRVAMTPLGNELRIGGTMELSGYNHNINMNRVKPIVAAANFYCPSLHLEVPTEDRVWAGLRPCSPDGLPYIGSSMSHHNVTVAGGHAMIGISLAAATGQIVSNIIVKKKQDIEIEAFRLDRF